MLSRKWLAIAAGAVVSVAAIAQQDQPPSSLATANAGVNAVAYASAFENYRANSDESETPDQAWRSANEAMARLGGHAGHLKDNPGQPAPTPAGRVEAVPRSIEADHGAHHHGEAK